MADRIMILLKLYVLGLTLKSPKQGLQALV